MFHSYHETGDNHSSRTDFEHMAWADARVTHLLETAVHTNDVSAAVTLLAHVVGAERMASAIAR